MLEKWSHEEVEHLVEFHREHRQEQERIKMSYLAKLLREMEVAKGAKVGMMLTYFDVAELLDEINSLKKYKAESESVISKAKDLLGDEMGEWLPVDPVYLPERLQQLRQVLYILEGLEKGA